MARTGSGRVIRFDSDGGYGFIEDDDVDEDIFFHLNDAFLEKSVLRRGLEVHYEIVDGDRGLRAIKVTAESDRFDRDDLVAELQVLLIEALMEDVPELTLAQTARIRASVVRICERLGLLDA